MHFRFRKYVVQLVRTSYNPVTKRPRSEVVGRMRLKQPELTPELREKLTDNEIDEVEDWIEGQHRMNSLKEELAALTLPESIATANRWFSLNADHPAAIAVVPQLLTELQSLRKTLRKFDLLE